MQKILPSPRPATDPRRQIIRNLRLIRFERIVVRHAVEDEAVNPEHRAIHHAAVIKAFDTPKWREAHSSEACKRAAKKRTPKWRENIKAAAAKRAQDPKWRTALSVAMKEYLSNQKPARVWLLEFSQQRRGAHLFFVSACFRFRSTFSNDTRRTSVERDFWSYRRSGQSVGLCVITGLRYAVHLSES